METNTKFYDIAFIGHYTKDTIVSSTGIRVVDGGAFNYGAHVAVRMGLKVAAVTRLAEEDFHVVEKLKHLGVMYSHTFPLSLLVYVWNIPLPMLTNGSYMYPVQQVLLLLPKWKKSKPEQLL